MVAQSVEREMLKGHLGMGKRNWPAAANVEHLLVRPSTFKLSLVHERCVVGRHHRSQPVQRHIS